MNEVTTPKFIFFTVGLLTYDTKVANLVRFSGWSGLLSTMLFITYQWNLYRKEHMNALNE